MLNHLFSLNIDKLWRSQAVNAVADSFACMKSLQCGGPSSQSSEYKVLDEACGTADLSIALAMRGYNVTGVDISQGMLDVGLKKINCRFVKLSGKKLSEKKKKSAVEFRMPNLQLADAKSLSFKDACFDAVTCAYGVRNFDDRAAAIREMLRVLAPGGALVVLEFAKPKNKFLRCCYNFYFNNFIPFFAWIFTLGKEGGAYSYFIRSVEKFPKFEAFCDELSSAGFENVVYKTQTFGISVLYKATKPCVNSAERQTE